jgi:hypothetical protein
MTTPATDRGGHAVSAQRSWQPALLTAAEPGRRNRRTIDGVVLAAGATVTGLAAVIASSAPAEDEDVAQALITVLGWAEVLWRFVLVSVLALALIAIALALVVSVVAVLTVPKLRAKVVPECAARFPASGASPAIGASESSSSAGRSARRSVLFGCPASRRAGRARRGRRSLRHCCSTETQGHRVAMYNDRRGEE